MTRTFKKRRSMPHRCGRREAKRPGASAGTIATALLQRFYCNGSIAPGRRQARCVGRRTAGAEREQKECHRKQRK